MNLKSFLPRKLAKCENYYVNRGMPQKYKKMTSSKKWICIEIFEMKLGKSLMALIAGKSLATLSKWIFYHSMLQG